MSDHTILQVCFSKLRLDTTNNLHLDPSWGPLVCMQGDVAIVIDQTVLYREPYFCLVELAQHVTRWLKSVTDAPSNFEYQSLEGLEPGAVWVRHVGDGWQVGSVYQAIEVNRIFSFHEIRAAFDVYFEQLRSQLQEQFAFDLDRFIHDPQYDR